MWWCQGSNELGWFRKSCTSTCILSYQTRCIYICKNRFNNNSIHRAYFNKNLKTQIEIREAEIPIKTFSPVGCIIRLASIFNFRPYIAEKVLPQWGLLVTATVNTRLCCCSGSRDIFKNARLIPGWYIHAIHCWSTRHIPCYTRREKIQTTIKVGDKTRSTRTYANFDKP